MTRGAGEASERDAVPADVQRLQSGVAHKGLEERFEGIAVEEVAPQREGRQAAAHAAHVDDMGGRRCKVPMHL